MRSDGPCIHPTGAKRYGMGVLKRRESVPRGARRPWRGVHINDADVEGWLDGPYIHPTGAKRVTRREGVPRTAET